MSSFPSSGGDPARLLAGWPAPRHAGEGARGRGARRGARPRPAPSPALALWPWRRTTATRTRAAHRPLCAAPLRWPALQSAGGEAGWSDREGDSGSGAAGLGPGSILARRRGSWRRAGPGSPHAGEGCGRGLRGCAPEAGRPGGGRYETRPLPRSASECVAACCRVFHHPDYHEASFSGGSGGRKRGKADPVEDDRLWPPSVKKWPSTFVIVVAWASFNCRDLKFESPPIPPGQRGEKCYFCVVICQHGHAIYSLPLQFCGSIES